MTIEIYRHLIFYISQSVFKSEIFNDIELEYSDLNPFLDKIIYFDEHDINFDANFNLLKLLTKQRNLRNNCFKIIELKERLDSDSFNYFSEQYLTHVVCYTNICKLLNTHFEEYSPVKDNHFKSIFNFQLTIFEVHLNEMTKISNYTYHELSYQGMIQIVKKSAFLIKLAPIKTTLFKKEDKVVQKNIVLPSIEHTNLETVKSLSAFIIHDKKVEIVQIIKEHLSDYRGISLRYLIEYLHDKKVLVLNTGDKKAIYRSFKSLFDNKDIAHYNSVFAKDIFNKNDNNYKKSVVVFNNLFDSIFSISQKKD